MKAMIAHPAAMLSGPALHTGAPSTVRFTLRADDGLGLQFFFPGFPNGLTAKSLSTLTRSARRATVLTDPVTGATIRTPEHLLAASLFFPRAPLDIHCDTAEIPGLDGSARPWFTALAANIPVEYAAAPSEYDTALTWSYDGSEGRITAEPADAFSVHYTLSRGEMLETVTLATASDAPATILPARTFIFAREWGKLREALADVKSSDVLGGVDAGSGLLLAETREEFARTITDFPENSENQFPLLHPRTFRMDSEAARHKVLDLLGDLALQGLALPRLRITIVNGGHALNHLLLDALQLQSSGYRESTHQGV